MVALLALTLGIGGAVVLGWLVARFVTDYRYRRLVKDRLEKDALDFRVKKVLS